ncbi:MAG: sialate O-acetylesterase [Planctomycetes bacterium]|nr:sialate O-acetylesterase [Planctomycetota bacterium]
MVLQQGMEAPVWGKADEGEKVTVTFCGQTVFANAKDGKWMVRLKPLKAGGPHTMTVAGKNTIEIKNVLVGEVWVCSGQSNMAMTVNRCANAEEEVANSKNPMLRLYTVPRRIAGEPQKNVEGKWVEAGPDTVGGFSGVGYFFGRELQKALKVPVGLIHTSWGGTPSEAWTSMPTLEATPEAKSILDRYAEAVKNLPKAMERFEAAKEKYKAEKLPAWRKAAAEAKKAGKPIPRRPRPPRVPYGPGHPHRPAGLYNGMIAPLIPFAIKGAIWYQGESNAGRAYQYRTLFPAMITDWRKNWGEGNFGFFFVQLAPFRQPPTKPEDSAWAELREAQLMTLSLPNTGMAVITDVGDAKNIHPTRKQIVGTRLALSARGVTYGEKIVHSGPVYKSMKVNGNKAVLTFDHIAGGLMVKDGDLMEHDGKLKGFTIAGKDKVFHNASAEIKGDKVVVSCPEVQKPAAVRYGWANYPIVNLYNTEGLPASPFRTDNWPGITQGK